MKKLTRICLLLWLLSCLAAASAENLIRNTVFEEDFAYDGVAFWDREAWDTTADVVFDVETISGYPCLHILSESSNDARWIQTVAVESETEYRLSGYILADNCSENDNARGANLSIYNSPAYSDSVFDTAGEWQYVEMYGKTGAGQTELIVCARIGGFSGDCAGEAWFRDIALEKVDAPASAQLNSFATYAPSTASSSGSSLSSPTVPNSGVPERHTLKWILIDAAFVILATQAYIFIRYALKKNAGRAAKHPLANALSEGYALVFMLALALLVRGYYAYYVRGYVNDVDCFLYWGRHFRESGFAFYADAGFHDYPPFYMILLGGMDKLRVLFHIEYNSEVHVFLIKLLPICCDHITAILFYGIGRRKMGALPAVFLTALIALNPAYIADSAAWGQIDSVLTLLLMLSVYFAYRHRWLLALPVYALAVLTKPQALMFGPLGLFALWTDVYKNHSLKRIWDALGGLFAALLVLVGICLPFALKELPFSREYSVTQYLKKANSDDAYTASLELGSYRNWYNDTLSEDAEKAPADGSDLTDATQREAFNEIQKSAAFAAEYALTLDALGDPATGFDAAESLLKEKHLSQVVFWEYLSSARLQRFKDVYAALDKLIDEDKELTASQWLFIETYDNLLSIPGLLDVLQQDPVPSKGIYLLTWLWYKLMGTAQSYKYVTVNACNLYVILDKNWKLLDDEFNPERMRYFAWFMVGASYVYASMILLSRRKKRKKSASEAAAQEEGGTKYLALAGATLMSLLYCFAPMMHERYLFPAIALSLLAYCQLRDRRILWYTILVSATQFLNIALVLQGGIYRDLNLGHLQASEKTINNLVSVANIAGALFLSFTAFDLSLGWKRKKKEKEPSPSRIKHPRLVYGALVTFITLTYAAGAFWNLGETNSPVTGYTTQLKNEQIVFDLGSVKTYRLTYYGGISNNHFTVALSNDGENWTEENAAAYGEGDMYKWIWYVPKTYANGSFTNATRSAVQSADTVEGGASVTYATASESYPLQTSRYVRFTVANEKYYSTVATQKMVLLEVGFIAEDGKTILPVASVTGSAEKADYARLIDEQDAVALYPSYYNGMYFDEIYHARTAYELLHGYSSAHILEWSHPHLGKLLIAIGIHLFGMTPFGWRFSGTLIGILMLPVFYLLVKQLSGKRTSALFSMLLMAFDSMHFTQTRIATVDSYAVFFILLMYLFMIRYFQMDLFKTRLWKQLLTLGLSGLCMGLACASKWTGIYASVGLALLFFIKTGMTIRDYFIQKRSLQPNMSVLHAYPPRLLATIDFCILAFVAVPVAIYYYSYYWHFAADGGLSFERVWQLQEQMFSYHSNVVDTHYFKSPWYEWPLIIWPMWYFSSDTAYTGRGVVSSISLMGNPAVWWPGILAMTACAGIWLMQKKKDKRLPVLLIAFASQYLPWVLVPRSTYIYHYFASVPFIIAAIALATEYLGEKYRRTTLWLRIALVVAAAALMIVFYPLESGYPCSYSYAEKLRWFDWYNFQLQ